MSSKCFDVARGEGGVGGEDDAGDHGVARVAWTPLQLQRGRKIGCLPCGCLIETGNSMLDNLASQRSSSVKSAVCFFPAGIDCSP